VRLLRWVTVAVLAVEVALLSTGRLGLGQAAIVLLGVEIAFAALIVTVAVWRFTGSRRTGGSIPGALGDAITAVLPPPVARLAAREAAQVAAVIRWIARRPLGVPEGAHPVGYGRDQVALVITFVALTAGEVAAVELLVPWPALRIMLLVLGGYGLLVMTGFVAINRTRPHVLDHHQVRLRCGLFVDITLSPTDIAAVALARHSCGYRPVITDGVLIMGAGSQTQLEIMLTEPRTMSVDQAAGTIERIRISADHPADAAQLLRETLEAHRTT